MEIVERREYDGAWWGCTPEGAWYRWSVASSGWEGPVAPPWPPPPPEHPDEAAIVAAAMAAGAATARAFGDAPAGSVTGSGGQPPMNRVDAWWNRRFPPFSTRRLIFGLVVLPVIAALVELLWVAAGREASMPRYLFVCVAGGALLATAWLPGMREMAERVRSSGALDTRSPWPWRRKRALPPPPPLPPLRETFRRDFLVALPFALAIVLVMSVTTIGPADTFTPSNLVMFVVASVSTAALVALRTSVWGLVIFSAAGGMLGGLALVALSLMTWSDPGLAEFLVGWAFGSALLFLHAYPIWLRMRDLEARGFRLPMWLVMGGSVLLVSGAALVFLAER
jgi:hypothetical protein